MRFGGKRLARPSREPGASSRPVTSAKTIRFGVAGIKNTFVDLRKDWIPGLDSGEGVEHGLIEEE